METADEDTPLNEGVSEEHSKENLRTLDQIDNLVEDQVIDVTGEFTDDDSVEIIEKGK